METTADRWGLIVTTKYTYTDSTNENPHIEEITVNNGASFGRVYDATSSKELVYLLSNGVTNIAITSTSENFYLTSAVTCNIKTNPIYDASTNQYLHYIFDLNGHTLNFTKDLTFDGVNVLIKNGFVVEGGKFGIIKENNANVSITHTFEKNVEILSDNSVSQANGIINEIKTKAYKNPSLAGSTRYTLEELNTALGENALSSYYVEVENASIYYKRLTIGGTTYKKGQIVSLSIDNNNFIDAEAYYVENGKLYVCAPIIATASAEQAPYTITGLTYDTSAFEITDKGNNEYDVVVKNGTSILYIKINGVEQNDIFLRKATENGVISFGFTGTDKVPNEDTYSYGLYPAGWIENIPQYAGYTKEFIADLYIVGKGTVHFKFNIAVDKNIETLSTDSINQANGIISEINTNVYNALSGSQEQPTYYTVEELNTALEALSKNTLSNYYVEIEDASKYYPYLTIGGSTYKKDQEVSLSIGNNNFIKDKAYYVEDGKLYVCAPIVATASAEQAPYTITGLAYDTSAFEITDKGNNEYDVVVKDGTKILYIKINGVEQNDIFLRKATDNGIVSFGFTGTDKVYNEDTYTYGIYPAGYKTDLSQYQGFTREFIADLYIVGKGTVHFTLNVSIPSTNE